MIAVSPFTFVDTTTDEAATCPTSPFVTKQSSAEFLQADPCYKKGFDRKGLEGSEYQTICEWWYSDDGRSYT